MFLFLIIFVLLILIGLSIFHDNPILKSFSDKIVILVLFFSAYTAYESYCTNREQHSYDNYMKISNNQFKIIEYMNSNYDKCPDFINTFFFGWQKKILSNDTIVETEINTKNFDNWITVYYISEMIFKSLDNYTSYINKVGLDKNINNPKNYKLINFFIQFTISNDLYNIWNIYKYKYPDHTIKFGDLLFQLTKKYNPVNVIELNNLVNIILNDKYYLLLFDKNSQ